MKQSCRSRIIVMSTNMASFQRQKLSKIQGIFQARIFAFKDSPGLDFFNSRKFKRTLQRERNVFELQVLYAIVNKKKAQNSG